MSTPRFAIIAYMAAQEEDQKSTLKTEVGEPVSEKDILSWTAPARPFKRRNRQFYVTVIAIAAIVGLILFLVDGFLPVLLVVSVVFLFYVLSTVEPENIEYKITSMGIKIADTPRVDWNLMRRFWFTKRFDSELLVVETATFPGRLELVTGSDSKENLKNSLTKYIQFEEAPASNLDKAANWFAQKLPGNK